MTLRSAPAPFPRIGNLNGTTARLAFAALVFPTFAFAATLTLEPVDHDGIYATGQPVAWNVAVTGDAASLKDASYTLKKNGREVVAEGTLDLTSPTITIESDPVAEPGTLLAEITATGPDGKPVRALGGAAISPEKITPTLPRPDDFDAFWADQLEALAEVPPNPQITPMDSGNPEVAYFQITFANVGGATIHTQLAHPKSGDKFPGMVIVQWAGVYGLQKERVVEWAARGWLVINVLPHDLPIDESPEFYRQQAAGPLKGYASIGNSSRETSYLRGMFLGALRATDYLASRPDWDGKTLVARGGSKGGYQSLMLAALDPRITAVLANIPAGCEITGAASGRASGWPSWAIDDPAKRDAIIETSRYFDAVNFASRIKAPTLIGLGLVDLVCPPTGIYSMTNELAGPSETVTMPLRGHKGPHPEFESRVEAWIDAISEGKPVPARP